MHQMDQANIDDYWNNIKKLIVLHSPERKCCLNWGNQILRAWKNAPKMDKENQGVEKRKEIETLIEDLFSCAIYNKKPYSQKFTWVIEAFLEEHNPSKKMQAMFFRCTMPVLWRNLEVPNEEVRLAASSIILNFYPLISEDEFIKAEYIATQQQAMLRMLMDPCVPVRIMAIKKLPQHLCKHWENFPRDLIKSYLETLVDQLSFDSLPEVRAAVYEGMQHLLPSPHALTAMQRTLEIMAKRGINDKAEKVRLAAFRMLSKLHGHRYIKLLDFVEFEEILLRLDIENSVQVQHQIVRLLFRPFIPEEIEGIDSMERFKRIYFMCKQSRNASFHFHHLIYPLKLISIEMAVHHIRTCLLGVKTVLKKRNRTESDESSEALSPDTDHHATFLNEPDEADKKIKIAKDVLDSIIVLWMAIRFDLFSADTKNVKLNSDVNRMMTNILEMLNQLPDQLLLMDSALIIASHLQREKIGKMYGRIKTKLETENTKHPHFSHYVEAFAAWDMNKLIEIIEKGLKKLRNDVILVTDPDKAMNTPRRRGIANQPRDSPPPKRVRMGENELLGRPLELIQMLLATPQTSEQLKTRFYVHLESFFESLSIIRNNFGKLLLVPGWEQKFDSQILYAAYETFNIMALITKKIEDPSKNNNKEISEAERSLPTNDRILYTELKWFASVIVNTAPSFQVIKMFLRCINLHLYSSQLTYRVLRETAEVLIKIKEIIEDSYDANTVELALKKSAECLKEALENCEEFDEANIVIEEKVKPLLNYLEETQPTIERTVTENDNNDSDEVE